MKEAKIASTTAFNTQKICPWKHEKNRICKNLGTKSARPRPQTSLIDLKPQPLPCWHKFRNLTRNHKQNRTPRPTTTVTSSNSTSPSPSAMKILWIKMRRSWVAAARAGILGRWEVMEGASTTTNPWTPSHQTSPFSKLCPCHPVVSSINFQEIKYKTPRQFNKCLINLLSQEKCQREPEGTPVPQMCTGRSFQGAGNRHLRARKWWRKAKTNQ